MDIANGTTPDQFGVIWPRGFEVCSVCGQPDSCGDCNHVALTSPEVALIIVGETNEDSPNEPRYDVDAHANTYYSLRSTLEGTSEEQGVYGIIDEKAGGYIAFTTSQNDADRIVAALSRTT